MVSLADGSLLTTITSLKARSSSDSTCNMSSEWPYPFARCQTSSSHLQYGLHYLRETRLTIACWMTTRAYYTRALWLHHLIPDYSSFRAYAWFHLHGIVNARKTRHKPNLGTRWLCGYGDSETGLLDIILRWIVTSVILKRFHRFQNGIALAEFCDVKKELHFQ